MGTYAIAESTDGGTRSGKDVRDLTQWIASVYRRRVALCTPMLDWIEKRWPPGRFSEGSFQVQGAGHLGRAWDVHDERGKVG